MANAFQVNVLELEKELALLITENEIMGRIDSLNKVHLVFNARLVYVISKNLYTSMPGPRGKGS